MSKRIFAGPDAVAAATNYMYYEELLRVNTMRSLNIAMEISDIAENLACDEELLKDITDDVKDEVTHVMAVVKHDEEKPRLDLVPKSLIWAVGEMLTVGAKKYGTHNWLNGLAWSRPYAATLRHLTAWQDGEDIDADSGKSHLWCAATEIAFLIEYEQKGIGQDDRYKKT